MTDPNQTDVVRRYFVNDVPDAKIPATRLRNILDSLQQGRQLSVLALSYLQQEGLDALQQLARGETSYEAFCKVAVVEQAKREQAAQAERSAKEAARLTKEAEYKEREAVRAAEYERERQRAEKARRARESDPKYIAKMRNQRLRKLYELDQFIEETCFARLMEILHRVDDGNRLADEDVLWLTTEGKTYYTEPLRAVFHDREAEFCAAEYSRTSDPWSAVNASGHYRKCKQPGKAHELLTSIPSDRQKAPKLKSAICTTHGGVMRDLGRLDVALKLGEQAHALTPKDFRPCTLLGAVNIEMGNLDIGWEWYRKAKERGASERSIDSDLRGIFLRADYAGREKIRSFLLSEDPVRYKWVVE